MKYNLSYYFGNYTTAWFMLSLLILSPVNTKAEVNNNAGHNVNYLLLNYDGSLNKYLPYIPSDKSHQTNFLIPLKRNDFPGTYLSLELPENSHLFLNGKYFYSTDNRIVKRIDTDSLFRIYQADSLFLGIYLPDENSRLLEVTILPKGSYALTNLSPDELRQRTFQSGFRDFLIMGFLLIAGYIAFLLNYDRKLFTQYTNAIKIFSGPEADNLLDRNKPVAGTDLLFIILEALLFGFFIYILFYGMNNESTQTNHEFLRSLFSWLIISVVILVWILARFNLVRNLSYLLQVREIGKIHFIESSRITLFMLIAYIVLSLILLFGINIEFNAYVNFLIRSLMVIAVLRFVLITVKILNYPPYKKIYIISYLCASELIPVVLGLKLILDSSLATWVI